MPETLAKPQIEPDEEKPSKQEMTAKITEKPIKKEAEKEPDFGFETEKEAEEQKAKESKTQQKDESEKQSEPTTQELFIKDVQGALAEFQEEDNYSAYFKLKYYAQELFSQEKEFNITKEDIKKTTRQLDIKDIDKFLEITEILREQKVEFVIMDSVIKLEQALNNRFQEFASSLKFNLTSPELPRNLSKEHLKIIEALYGKNTFEPSIIPNSQDLDNFSEEYINVMYPETQQPEDKQKGLISYPPNWWNKQAEVEGFDFSSETWGQAYIRSMKQELTDLNQPNKGKPSFILLETTQKPIYQNGKQQYGTKEGNDPSKDPFLSIFQEVFGDHANRFDHSHNELTEKLLPQIEEKIKQIFQQQNLPIPNFKVILIPAHLANQQMTLLHPENSQTNTSEWTDTTLIDKQQQDSGRRLAVGDSVGGGASDVFYGRGDVHWLDRGCRLVVVFYS